MLQKIVIVKRQSTTAKEAFLFNSTFFWSLSMQLSASTHTIDNKFCLLSFTLERRKSFSGEPSVQYFSCSSRTFFTLIMMISYMVYKVLYIHSFFYLMLTSSFVQSVHAFQGLTKISRIFLLFQIPPEIFLVAVRYFLCGYSMN